jgi:hypothetical protein
VSKDNEGNNNEESDGISNGPASSPQAETSQGWACFLGNKAPGIFISILGGAVDYRVLDNHAQ